MDILWKAFRYSFVDKKEIVFGRKHGRLTVNTEQIVKLTSRVEDNARNYT